MAACDVRFGCADSRFTVPAGKLGVIYHPRGLARIRAVFGDALTSRMILAGETVSGIEAEAAGALAATMDGADLQPHAEAFARRTREGAARSRSAHRRWLRLLARGAVGREQADEYEQMRRDAYASDDYVDRLRALRQPKKCED
jgi:enoyl-CoA hydratase